MLFSDERKEIVTRLLNKIPTLIKNIKISKDFDNCLTLIYSTVKVLVFYRFHAYFIGFFTEETQNQIAKLYINHISIAMSNFNINFEEISKQDFYLNDENIKYDSIYLKMFENFFLRYITSHYFTVYDQISIDEEMNLNYIKFKNLYMVDISTQSIIFDLVKARNKKTKDYYKNKEIWDEILYHSKLMKDTYQQELGNIHDTSDSAYRFVKIEFTSTYPRLTFTIKFLPIFNGISIIHIYTQNKLSRSSENESNIISKGYKEIDILLGTDMKNNPTNEFKYAEPKKLKQIEEFFIEFFIVKKQNFHCFYYDLNSKFIKYFDHELINIINEIIEKERNKKKVSLPLLINKINENLPKRERSFIINTHNNSNSQIFTIPNELKAFYDKNKDQKNTTINLSKIDDQDNQQRDDTIILTNNNSKLKYDESISQIQLDPFRKVTGIQNQKYNKQNNDSFFTENNFFNEDSLNEAKNNLKLNNVFFQNNENHAEAIEMSNKIDILDDVNTVENLESKNTKRDNKSDRNEKDTREVLYLDKNSEIGKKEEEQQKINVKAKKGNNIFLMNREDLINKRQQVVETPYSELILQQNQSVKNEINNDQNVLNNSFYQKD